MGSAINNSFSARLSRGPVLRYAAAIGSTLLAWAVCAVLSHIGVTAGTYPILLVAVGFSAWFCGVGPALVATAILLVGALFRFLPQPFAPLTRNEWIAVVAFLMSSGILIALGESRRRQNDLLLKAQNELESKVEERTADLDAVNRNLRELSARLMQLQDDERRRIARELHDSVGQTLAALAMNLSLVRGDVERLSSIAAALTDSEGLVRAMSTEVRTISHLLHPPLLDEAGLLSAIRWYTDGFAKRSKIKVDLDLPEEMGRLSSEMETAIFRIVQECLTNIHRHSESPIAKIQVRQRHDYVLVEIQDKGKGIPLEKQEEMALAGTPGVGIRGMRERLRQLGGTLEISSNSHGTLVSVRLPVAATHRVDDVTLAGPAAA
jgi:signal transduction histidine kinase